MFDQLRNKAMQQGMKLMSDPRFMKLMSSPRAQKMMMLAFQLPGRIESMFAAEGKAIAKRFKLATRDEVETLKSTIRDLERSLKAMQHDDEHGNAHEGKGKKAHGHSHTAG